MQRFWWNARRQASRQTLLKHEDRDWRRQVPQQLTSVFPLIRGVKGSPPLSGSHAVLKGVRNLPPRTRAIACGEFGLHPHLYNSQKQREKERERWDDPQHDSSPIKRADMQGVVQQPQNRNDLRIHTQSQWHPHKGFYAPIREHLQ